MTEAEWLECSMPNRLLNRVREPRSSNQRAYRLLLSAYCAWQSSRPLTSSDAEHWYLRAIQFEEWAETNVQPEGLREHPPEDLRDCDDTRMEVERLSLMSLRHRDDQGCAVLCSLVREIFGNPFRPVAFSTAWRTDTAVALAAQMYASRNFSIMPILGDALQDAGCDSAEAFEHCQGGGPHVRGCWVVDLILGKE